MQYLFWPIWRFLTPRHRLWYWCYRQIDAAFRRFDDRRLQITEHLKLIPPARYRTGGQSAITEFAHSAGVISAYVGQHLAATNPHVLDLGCGTGKMVAAVWPFLGSEGHYTGLDISQQAITFDQSWYPPDRCTFIHADLYNSRYNPDGQSLSTYVWPLADGSIDLAVAFSLFTHLNQPDSMRYFDELARVLKPGSPVLFTFFVIDEHYSPDNHLGTRWCFDRTIEGQPDWQWASWFSIPENQIAITMNGLKLLAGDRFDIEAIYNGWWAGKPGAFLQDTVVFRRKP